MYAVVGGLTVIKVGMRQVETNIHDAYHYPTAGEGLWQTNAVVNIADMQLQRHGVHLYGVATVVEVVEMQCRLCFYAQHLRME